MGKLTALAVKAAKEPGRYIDGQGLMLVVKPSGARSWQLRVQVDGRRRDIGLGSASTLSLSEAREKALETRKLIRSGVDPVEAKRSTKRPAAAARTFKETAEALHLERAGDWKNEKHRAQWITTLRTYAFPAIGDVPVAKVAGPAIRDLLVPIWQSKPETARRVLQRIGTVLDWAHSTGERESEAPMRSIRAGLPRQTKQAEHFESLPYADVPPLMAKLREADTAGRLALRFLILTAARSGEVRGATWEEVDLTRGLWSIPATRMKAKRAHVVPLSAAAVEVLETAKALRAGVEQEPIFPGIKRQPLSDMTLTKVLRTAVDGAWTVHGFRSSFRDWTAECTDVPREIAEEALAHVLTNKVEAAYRRTNFLDKRRSLMADWAEFATGSTTHAS